MMGASVFALPVLDRWLVTAPLLGLAALANRPAVCALKEALAAGESGPVPLAAFARTGPEPAIWQGPLRPPFLGLIPTRSCDLACVYCDFGADAAQGAPMDAGLAVAAVDWMADQACEAGSIGFEVHFFGGEPFCAEEVVRVAVHRARMVAAQRNLGVRFEAATHGAYGKQTALFAGDYLDTIVLSLDGPAHIQDRHRPRKSGEGSFEAVARNAALWSDMPADLCIRVCVTDQTVSELEGTTRWLCESFSPTTIDFETLKPTRESDLAGLRPPDPYEFASACVRASLTAAAHGVEPVYAAAHAGPRLSFCPVGSDGFIVSPDGRVSACYLQAESWRSRGMDLDIGAFGADGQVSIRQADVQRLREMVADKPGCEGCFCRWTCAGGCHVCHSCPGAFAARPGFCTQTRIITACRMLSGMGCGDLVGGLLASRGAQEALALRPTDRLTDFPG